METIFMNTLNSKINESNKFIYQFTDNLDIKSPNKNMALANLNIYYTWKNIKSEYKNNKFKISAPIWNDTFDLPDGSYSIADIQNYFEYIIKKHETIVDSNNLPIIVYVNKTKNRVIFKIETGYKLEIFIKRNIGSSSNTIDSDKNGELVPKLEVAEVVLVHCNLANDSHQQASKVLFTFVPNKQFGQLITITPHLPTML